MIPPAEYVGRVDASAFDPAAYAPGGRYALWLQLGREATERDLPVLLARGAAAGPCLAVIAGVHGDEYEGVQALLEVWQELDPSALRGALLAVTIANPPAFWNGTRLSPLDGCNLAREFPGRPCGSPSQVIAHHIAQAVIGRANFLLDFHTAGAHLRMPTLVGCDAGDTRSRAAAAAFGARVIWAHERLAPGRTISFAAERKIPWLYTEGRGGGRVDPDDCALFQMGLRRLMRHLNMTDGALEAVAPPALTLVGDGDLDQSAIATKAGFFLPTVELLQRVRAGEEIGQTLDPHGAKVERFTTPSEGVVAMLRATPVVRPGDALFLVTQAEGGPWK